MEDVILSVSDFVAVFNQTLEYAYPNIVVQGELANFRVSKNKWVYFDLKDDNSSVKFFGTIYQLPGPLEDGMLLQVRGVPRLHNMYGFSINVQSMQPAGEGSIKKAAALLEAKLQKEGLFDEARKRSVLYPPEKIALITSKGSAAHHDFIKILGNRWGGVDITLIDVQVQGEIAPSQLVRAIEYCNQHLELDCIVLTRGGGSPEDLAAFSDEKVVRAVVASRWPTVVAIGHEVDVSLAELAADKRASTPSNAAELLVPDKQQELKHILGVQNDLSAILERTIMRRQNTLLEVRQTLQQQIRRLIEQKQRQLAQDMKLLTALNPQAALSRGYAIVRQEGLVVRSVKEVSSGVDLDVQLRDGSIKVKVN